MINKAINHLVLATVDSLTKFKNKLAYYLAIFAMVLGSTFGAMNAAKADWVIGTTSVAAGSDNAVMVSAGDGIAGAVTVTNSLAASSLDITGDEEIATLALTTSGNTAHTLTITGGSIADVLTVTANMTSSAGDDLTIALNSGKITTAGDTIIASAAPFKITLGTAADIDFTKDGGAHAATVLGQSAGYGDMAVKDDATFSGAIGATAIASLTVDTGVTGTFNAAV